MRRPLTHLPPRLESYDFLSFLRAQSKKKKMVEHTLGWYNQVFKKNNNTKKNFIKTHPTPLIFPFLFCYNSSNKQRGFLRGENMPFLKFLPTHLFHMI